MKRKLYFLTLAVVAILMAGCGFLGGDTTYTASDLSGTWTEETNPQCFWVYTLTKDDSGEYYWGKTWDESEGYTEEDLEFHGNGWFKWSIANNTITQLHMMNISQATVPKTYSVASCANGVLALKDTNGNRISFNKVK